MLCCEFVSANFGYAGSQAAAFHQVSSAVLIIRLMTTLPTLILCLNASYSVSATEHVIYLVPSMSSTAAVGLILWKLVRAQSRSWADPSNWASAAGSVVPVVVGSGEDPRGNAASEGASTADAYEWESEGGSLSGLEDGIPRAVITLPSVPMHTGDSEGDRATEDGIALSLALAESREDAEGAPHYEWNEMPDAFADPAGGAGITRASADMPAVDGQSVQSYNSAVARAGIDRLRDVLQRGEAMVANIGRCLAVRYYALLRATDAALPPAPTQSHSRGVHTPVPNLDVLHFRMVMEFGSVRRSVPRKHWGRIEPKCRAVIAAFVGILPDRH
mmetsp:Transcript_85064/g.275441  ORF Transcript_85064/g.275441 Transcript_85064/m.275441 type:complete len:331 (-) Transcript_85064:16-1008(-)